LPGHGERTGRSVRCLGEVAEEGHNVFLVQLAGVEFAVKEDEGAGPVDELVGGSGADLVRGDQIAEAVEEFGRLPGLRWGRG